MGKLRQDCFRWGSTKARHGSPAQHPPTDIPSGFPSFSQVMAGTGTPVIWQVRTRGVPMSASSTSCSGSWMPGGSEDEERGWGV